MNSKPEFIFVSVSARMRTSQDKALGTLSEYESAKPANAREIEIVK